MNSLIEFHLNCNILDYNIAQKERLDESNSIAKYLFEKMMIPI